MILTKEHIKKTVQDYFKDKPVKKVYLFGSYARGDANENSDVDLVFSLVDNTRITYFGLARYLVDLQNRFSKNVDLVEEEFVYPEIKEQIEKENFLLFN